MTLKERHKKADREIIILMKSVPEPMKAYEVYYRMSALTGKHPETMKNYCNGKGADGYVKDVIIAELKKLAKPRK